MSLNERKAVVPENLFLESPTVVEDPTIVTSDEENAPYSIYTPRQKLYLSAFAGLLAFISPLSANIYFPVLPQLSQDYGRSSSAINLSITL
jgi:hypothetical protein